MHLVATLDLGPLRTMIKGMDYAAQATLLMVMTTRRAKGLWRWQ